MSLALYDRQIDELTEKFVADAQRSVWQPKKVAQSAAKATAAQAPELLELTWNLASGSVYAEQLGLEAASIIVTEAPDATAKLIGATAVADEGRHSSVFAYYAEIVGGAVAPVPGQIADISAALLGMTEPAARAMAHMLLEGFASDEFLWFTRGLARTGLGEAYRLVRRDENRHVALGLNYLVRAAGLRLLRALPPEELLGAERTVVRYSDLEAIETLVRHLLPATEPGRVVRWMRRRHEKRMALILGAREDRAELAAHRRAAPVWSAA